MHAQLSRTHLQNMFLPAAINMTVNLEQTNFSQFRKHWSGHRHFLNLDLVDAGDLPTFV